MASITIRPRISEVTRLTRRSRTLGISTLASRTPQGVTQNPVLTSQWTPTISTAGDQLEVRLPLSLRLSFLPGTGERKLL
ncbi:hypothetical protein XENOCAPTIV_006118 [Xenoophorus captivus]|uniref:Uncharacterized protein n=1 Tax=Xenoophorus captivus TaxID=1517983 RepID=A0ABV0RFV8_9TELE